MLNRIFNQTTPNLTLCIKCVWCVGFSFVECNESTVITVAWYVVIRFGIDNDTFTRRFPPYVRTRFRTPPSLFLKLVPTTLNLDICYVKKNYTNMFHTINMTKVLLEVPKGAGASHGLNELQAKWTRAKWTHVM